jgi:hypothetical protein
MSETRIDKIAMLLSTDWFFDHWGTIGLAVPSKERKIIQAGCRDIVKQIMGGVKNYYLTVFSNVRINQTRSLFNTLLGKVKLGEGVTKRLNALVSAEEDPRLDDGLRWLLTHITNLFLNESPLIQQHKLNPAIRERLQKACDESGLFDPDGVDFEELCLDSTSQWDEYIRSLTPDQPTVLSDYLETDLIRGDRFEIIWSLIHAELSPTQNEELMNWYRSAARSLTGGEVTFPHVH